MFSHWEILDQDPNFIPVTEEEIEESGYNIVSLGNNIARMYIDNVRKRKVSRENEAESLISRIKWLLGFTNQEEAC